MATPSMVTIPLVRRTSWRAPLPVSVVAVAPAPAIVSDVTANTVIVMVDVKAYVPGPTSMVTASPPCVLSAAVTASCTVLQAAAPGDVQPLAAEPDVLT